MIIHFYIYKKKLKFIARYIVIVIVLVFLWGMWLGTWIFLILKTEPKIENPKRELKLIENFERIRICELCQWES